MSHLRGKKNGFCQGTIHRNELKTALSGGDNTVFNISIEK